MIKKPLLVSLAAAALLTGNANAASMFDRMTAMEQQMKALETELADVKQQNEELSAAASEEEEATVAVAENEEEDGEEGEDDEEGEASFQEETEEALEYFDERISELNKNTTGNHLKFGVDFRTSVDNLQYKMADGSTQKNDALLTNRLWLNMNWLATDNLSFTGQLAYNNAYGARSGFTGQIAGFETFDWITNENPYDGIVRVKSAYFFYRNDELFGADLPWTFSVGRRPSTNGHIVNLRDDDVASSPMGHNINVEFDGASAKFTVYQDWGTYFKFCAGQGGTNANTKFFSTTPTGVVVPGGAPYAEVDGQVPDIYLGGVIFVPYDDGQYSIGTQYYYASNLIDANIDFSNPAAPQMLGMQDVGGMHAFTANMIIDGVGNGWSEFLDETTIFASAAVSITNPKTGAGEQGMLGSQDALTGYSAWAGIQFPSLISNAGRWGLEYNKGTANWRSITYAEDTLAGSKLAARGDAYEAYFTEPLIGDIFSFQLRYTYIDYKYTGSNGFFGSTTGKPQLISTLTPQQGSAYVVDTAQDIRAYLRYRF